MVYFRDTYARLVRRAVGTGIGRVPGDGAAPLPRGVRGGREQKARGGRGCASSGQLLDNRLALAGGGLVLGESEGLA